MNVHTTFLGEKRVELDPPVRGDPITAERYVSADYMKREFERLWPKVWHIGAMEGELEEPGDFARHDFGKESVFMIRQRNGSVKAFYNSCRHRGNRLVVTELGGGDGVRCSYHGWKYGLDGVLMSAQDADDVVGGDPCGKLKLVEVPCASWGGFIWFSFAPEKPLLDWLAPLPAEMANYGMETWTRVMYLTAEVHCNWKIVRDNFNESYHLPTLHPELATFINDDFEDTIFEMYPSGHNRMVMKGGEATGRAPSLFEVEVPAPLDDIIRAWGLDPAAYKGRGRDIRTAMIEAKRKLGPQRGFRHYARMTDSELVDYYHYTLFPNTTLTMSADGFQMLRTEPHPTDPEKCVFDHWFIAPPVEGVTDVMTPIGALPFKWSERRRLKHGDGTLGAVADQDLSIVESQQLGLNSKGFAGCTLTGQEKRIQRFHELLDDTLNGKL
jgi:phenylpropionate dioxygenase-like ring-hydroxylating dioxygenase large terminal subunit